MHQKAFWKTQFMKRKVSVIALLIIFLTSAQTARAQVVQHISLGKSFARFAVQSSWLSFTGKFTKFAGTIELSGGKALSLRSVQFEVDFSRPVLDLQQGAALDIDSLLGQIPRRPAKFKSTRIVKKAGDKYLIQGVLEHGGKPQPFELTVKAVAVDRRQSVFEIAEQGQTSQINPADRPAFLPADGQGQINARLVFE